MADVAAWGAVLAILMKLFPSKVGKIMSWTEMFFGVGFMVGPALGSYLYTLGGFKLPFISVGVVGFIVAFCMIFIIPDVQQETKKSQTNSRLGFTDVLSVSFSSIFSPNLFFYSKPLFRNRLCSFRSWTTSLPSSEAEW